jgi:addiction module HigA family antidote
MIPKNRIPSHPGEILMQDFLAPKKMSQVELARKMHVPIQRINTLIKGKRDVSPETAIILSRVLNTMPEFWMNLQTARDLALSYQNMATG